MSKERFIPFRKTDIVQMCENLVSASIPQSTFADFSRLLISRIHYHYHDQLESLKNNYAPFDPNRDTRILTQISATEKQRYQEQFAQEFAQLLDSANFEKITHQDLQDALKEESLFKVRLAVSFDDFTQAVFYRRGESVKKEVLTSWFGLRKKEIEFTNYDRVAVYITFKDEAYFSTKRKVPLGYTPGATIVKLFQNVPKADLEMLFPNSEVRMRPIDKVIIGASAAIGGVVVLVTKLGASILLIASLFAFWFGLRQDQVEITQQHLITFGIGMGVFGSFVFREWTKFKNRKIQFMKTLADNLYFKNLDNNAGVFHTLVDTAEEEDCKESLLAYTFLLTQFPTGTDAETLDKTIEAWFAQHHACSLDFDVSDALDKLVAMDLVTHLDARYQAVSLGEAISRLDDYWDNIYQTSH